MMRVEEVLPILPPIGPQEITGCSLQAIRGIYTALCPSNAYEGKELATFDAYIKPCHGKGGGGYNGQYIQATLVSVAECNFSCWPKGYNWEKVVEALEKRGFQLLGKFPGAHPENFGSYQMRLYGKGFTLPTKEK